MLQFCIGMISSEDRKKLHATGYLEARLSNNPQTSRFAHCLASLYDDQSRIEDADKTYKLAIKNAPANVMIRNDYAVHLAQQKRTQDAVEELQRALLINNEQPTLHKNLGAIEASRGNYREAMQRTQQAVLINSNDAVNHRNFAKVKNALGDTRSAYKHNITSMELEQKQHVAQPNTQAYRTAAVQNITLGGDHSYSVSLMDQARRHEHKHFDKFEFVSTRRTNEIVNGIAHRKGHPMEILEKMMREVEEKKALEDAVKRGDLSVILRHRGK